MDDVVRGLSEKLVAFLETGTVADGLFRPDVFLDLTMPTWRVQATGVGTPSGDRTVTTAAPTPSEVRAEARS